MVLEKAKCDYKTTRDHEEVLDYAYDWAIQVWRRMKYGDVSEAARKQWWDYTKSLDTELFRGLRIGTDYDYDNMLVLGFKK
jgi:hypothetical protein